MAFSKAAQRVIDANRAKEDFARRSVGEQKRIKSKIMIEKKKITSEKTVDKWLVRCIEDVQGMCIKNHPMTNAGIPDRLCHLRAGRPSFYVELKTTGEECDLKQIDFHRKLKALGIDTYVLDTKIENINDLWLVGYTTYPGNHYHKNPFKDKPNSNQYKYEMESGEGR